LAESSDFLSILVLLGLAAFFAGAGLHALWRHLAGGQDQFRKAYENSPDATQIIGPESKVVFCNRAFKANFGSTKLAFPALLRPNAVADPESLKRLEDIEAAARDGREWQCVLRLTAPPGDGETYGTRFDQGKNMPSALPSGAEETWCRLSVLPLKGRSETILWRLHFLNIDQRDSFLLNRERRQLAELASGIGIGLAAFSSDGRLSYSNDAFADLLEVTAADLRADPPLLHDLLTEPPREASPDRPFAEPDLLRGEASLRAPLGNPCRVELLVTPPSAKHDEARWTWIACRDLAARLAQEEAIIQAQKHLESSFRQAPVGIAIADGQGQIREANGALSALLGVPFPKGLKGKGLTDFVVEEDRALLRQVFDDWRTSGKFASEGVTIRLSTDKAASFWLVPIESDAEQRSCYAYLVDTTAQRDLELRFSQAQKMQAIGQLAGGIAHDFNNLLTAMIGFSDLLLLRHRPGDQSFADIMQIKQNANRAANLVRQLLAFSRQQTLQPRMLNLTDVLTELMHLLRRLMGEKIKLEVKHGRDLGLVRADKGQIEQVITNLAVNARDAMLEGGVLSIETANEILEKERGGYGDRVPAGSYVTITVSDQGTGIPRSEIEKIFEPFYSTKAVGAGTGLGLSTVHGIIKQSGGHIIVESDEGKGTTFTIYLPHHAAEKAAGEPKGQEAKRRDLSGSGRVLLVEDETAVRNFSARVLRNKGYEVFEAASGENALKVLEQTGGEWIWWSPMWSCPIWTDRNWSRSCDAAIPTSR
jgi:two-component system cell cycle sensor histidine kinase/response regulator CckA